MRTVGSRGPKTMEAIMAAGVRLIYEHGYDALTLRQLAREVGLQPGSLYNYIETKQDLLVTLLRGHLTRLLVDVDQALAGVQDPLEKLRVFVEFHLMDHMVRKADVFIANSELRSLEPENRREIVSLRRAYERRLIDTLDECVAQGRLAPINTHVAAFAIIAMVTGICAWYRPDGPLTKAELVRMHTDMVFSGLPIPDEKK